MSTAFTELYLPIMHTISNKQALRDLLLTTRQSGLSIALVPTMGNLHEGHLQLVREARSRSDFVVTSIFVNPLQFGPNEDLNAYPRTLDEDIAKLNSTGCDCLFAPSVTEIYGSKLASQSTVRVPELTANYCGKSRPGHFDGVTTVVCKLFNLVSPDTAVFGLKDYQQFLIIRKMIVDLEFNIELVGVDIQREDSGLAMSSRNRYLDDNQRQQAAQIYQTLQATQQRISSGATDFAGLEADAVRHFTEFGFSVDYFSICNADTLLAASKQDRDFVILTAVHVGASRLLDNVRFTLQAA